MDQPAERRIALLYNDLDRTAVTAIRDALIARLTGQAVHPWMASEDMDCFGSIFEQIEDAIAGSMGAVVFLSVNGLGRFQRNIELWAVATEVWQQGREYGTLLVHLHGPSGVEVPRPLLRWATVNHDGSIEGAAALGEAILLRFGLAAAANR